jgi:hypothetical protein
MKRYAFCVIVGTLLIFITNCTASPSRRAEGVTTTHPATPTILVTPSIRPTSAQTHTRGVSDEWRRVHWQNITIPIPPKSFWHVVTSTLNPIAQTPIITASYILPEQVSPVLETLSGPGFYILEFTGSLDQWIQRVQEESVHEGQLPFQVAASYDLEIAHRPAKAYPPLISGVSGYAEMYVLQLDNKHILLIWVEDSTNATTIQILHQITIDE